VLRDKTDRAWFGRLLRHPARNRSGSIISTPEPARGPQYVDTVEKISPNLGLLHVSEL